MRIGILGAGDAAIETIIGPASRLGHQVVVVASRSLERAKTFASAHEISDAVDDYTAVIERADLDLIYLGMVNAAHAHWAVLALDAGSNILVEKPFTLDAEQARAVMVSAGHSGASVFDGYHYAYHPMFARVLEVVTSGELGPVMSVDARVSMVRPATSSTRWSYDLGGGSLLDLGCYGLDACGRIAAALGGEARIASATARTAPVDPRVDARMDVRLDLGRGVHGRVRCSIDESKVISAARDAWNRWRDHQAATRGMVMTLRIVGARGSMTVRNFVLSQLDDRLIIRTKSGTRVERRGRVRSYDMQLQAIAHVVANREPWPMEYRDPVCTMRLIDEATKAAGLPGRSSGAWSPLEPEQ